MDFTFTTEQDEAAALAAQILKDKATSSRMRELELTGTRFDPDLWRELASAGLLSLGVSEDYDGAGLGLIEVARVLVEVGRATAAVPAAPHLAASSYLSEAGGLAAASVLSSAVAGTSILAVALSEDHAHTPEHPTTTATAAGDGWTLSGVKTIVAAGTIANAFLVTASVEGSTGVFLVTADASGVQVEGQSMSDGDQAARITFAGAPAVRVDTETATAERLTHLWTLAVCAQQLGVVEGAIALTSQYARTREQFGRPIGTFQAVSQRLADGYIEALGESLTLWQAAWRLEERLPAATEIAIAKLWASDAGHKVAHTTVHVHGGVGIDLDGEAHRYFTMAKRFEFLAGHATAQALAIGRTLATQPV